MAKVVRISLSGMNRKTWTEEQLIEAVKKSTSVSGAMTELGLKTGGGAHRNIKQHIARLGLDTKHFTGQAWNKGMTGISANIRPVEDYLTFHGEVEIASHNLKMRLLKEGMLERKCYSCGLIDWMGKPIPIQLEHIDGDHYNNLIENLIILCPNCHAQTDTYCGKNKGRVAQSAGGGSLKMSTVGVRISS